MFSNKKKISFDFLDSSLSGAINQSIYYSEPPDMLPHPEPMTKARKLYSYAQSRFSNLNMKAIIYLYGRVHMGLEQNQHKAGMERDANSTL